MAQRISLKLLSALALITLIGLGLKLPIYTDEIAWKILRARIWLDPGYTNLLGAPQCASPLALAGHLSEPWIFTPARWLDALLYGRLSNPFWLRIIGTIQAVLSFFVFLWAIKPALKNLRPYAGLFLLGFLLLGTTPLLMLMNRPEQPMLLLLGTLLGTFLRLKQPSWKFVTGFFVILMFFLAQHAKTIWFIPFILTLILTSPLSHSQKMTSLVGTLLFTLRGVLFYQAQYTCPQDETITRIVTFASLNPGLLFHDPSIFFERLFRNIVGFRSYLYSIYFSGEVMSRWLPELQSPLPWFLKFTNLLIRFDFQILGLGLFLLVIAQTVQIAKKRKGNRRSFWILLSLVISLMGVSGFQNVKNAYESILVMPIFGLVLCLSLDQNLDFLKKTSHRKIPISLIYFTVLMAVFSQMALWSAYGPFRNTRWIIDGSIPGQPNSVSTYISPDFKNQFSLLMTDCGLGNTFEQYKNHERLIVDDLTYTQLWMSKRPFHIFNVTWYWPGKPKTLLDGMIALHSNGLIAQCHHLSLELQNLAHQNRFGICCLKTR